ncbi:SMP-30/gluconolactonase/LRE family protein [Planctomycetales bacterium ZRK34]|nr:SMP-30/gluconolactonase/LRE family protein [Planctomycetales bacterium ZRK34]
MIEAEPVWPIRAELGEGPIWWDGSLYWIDINAPALHIYTPATQQRRSFELAEKIGTVVPRADGKLILAQETGLHVFDPAAGAVVETLPWPADCPIVERFNDGKCDPQGRFWVGTMGRDKPIASLYRVEPGCRVTEMLTGVRISNGLCWDEPRGRFYFIDSPTKTLDVFDWDPATGMISNRRALWRLPEGETGVPDGMTIDTEGRLWVAIFDGFGVHCIDPDSGQSLQKIAVGAAKTTACWFGGEGLDELYITTASIREDEASLKRHPHAGSLFMCRPGARGLATTPCAI